MRLKKPPKISEKLIQRQILDWLELKQYCHWRNYVGPIIQRTGYPSPNPMAGLPDIFGVFKTNPGKLFAIEVKTKTGKLSPKQIKWIESLNKAGVVAFVAKDLETVIESLAHYETG